VIQKTNHQILSKELSDGEHQFLHTIGIALLYKNTSSLFLLDEPETHFNPDWRAKYISVLKKCFEGDKQTPEVLISSHSPFIVSDTKEDNVLIFEKDENGKVDCKKADFNTFGASVNKITMKVFGKKETIGDVAKDKLAEYKKRLDADEDIDTIIHDIDLELGESVEKILFMKMLFDKQEAR
jgi:restriction system-associated AAA family ATPase